MELKDKNREDITDCVRRPNQSSGSTLAFTQIMDSGTNLIRGGNRAVLSTQLASKLIQSCYKRNLGQGTSETCHSVVCASYFLKANAETLRPGTTSIHARLMEKGG